jgi:hypothetical protein
MHTHLGIKKRPKEEDEARAKQCMRANTQDVTCDLQKENIIKIQKQKVANKEKKYDVCMYKAEMCERIR